MTRLVAERMRRLRRQPTFQHLFRRRFATYADTRADATNWPRRQSRLSQPPGNSVAANPPTELDKLNSVLRQRRVHRQRRRRRRSFVPGPELPHAACREGGPLYEWGDAGKRSPLNLHVTDATGDMMEKTQ
jgi:hypothetical protein